MACRKTKNHFMNLADWIVVDREILGGEPVLKGTRVPVKALFDYLERGYTLDEFLECFPSVSKDLAGKVWEFALVCGAGAGVKFSFKNVECGPSVTAGMSDEEFEIWMRSLGAEPISPERKLELEKAGVWRKRSCGGESFEEFKKFSLESAMRGMEDGPDFHDETPGDGK
jgi:uncharacterized protein (DUF433 family)